MHISKLQKLLDDGHDSAMLRFGLGKAYFDSEQWPQAAEHLRVAIELQQNYSAAWQLLGQALHADGQLELALDVFEQGVDVSRINGDQQAQKVMQVMANRVQKALADC